MHKRRRDELGQKAPGQYMDGRNFAGTGASVPVILSLYLSFCKLWLLVFPDLGRRRPGTAGVGTFTARPED